MVLYLTAVALVVYLFPKGGQFKYEFQKGKPWQYENYYAPFDFAIQKTQEEIDIEVREIEENATIFFEFDEEQVLDVKELIENKTKELLENASIPNYRKSKLIFKQKSIVDELYENGFIDDSNLNKVSKGVITLRRGNTIKEIAANKLITESEIFEFISSNIGEQPFSQEEEALLNIIYESVKPNVFFDEEFTKINLDEAL